MATEEELAQEVHGATFLQVLGQVVAGQATFTDKETYLRRLSICAECPFKVKRLNVCGKCGCVLPLKARFETTRCPVGNW